MKVEEILRAAPDAAFWRRAAPGLRVGEARPMPTWKPSPDPAEHDRLRTAGWARVERVVPEERVAGLAGAIRSLADASIPTPALYVFDEAWDVASGLAPTLAGLLGAAPRFLPDVWAWRIPSTAGASGWAPHRGVSYDVRDARGEPTLVNAWIALSDVTEASACMHVVPLDRDPFYPAALGRVEVDRARAVPLPAPAGSVLAWNANVLHFGGPMRPGATPRLSMSFSIVTEGGNAPDAPPTFPERVDLLADMLVTYAPMSGMSGAWLEWARLWAGMRDVRRRR